jgi:glucose/arabinose dehydrogenase
LRSLPVPGAQAATVETVARGLDNPRGVAVAPDGSVFVASAGHGGNQCEGEGAQCAGFTSRIVRYNGSRARTYARCVISALGPDGTFALGADGSGRAQRAPHPPRGRQAGRAPGRRGGRERRDLRVELQRPAAQRGEGASHQRDERTLVKITR